jgi:hypothetical protein
MLFGYLLSTQKSRFSLQYRYAQGVKELSPGRFRQLRRARSSAQHA